MTRPANLQAATRHLLDATVKATRKDSLERLARGVSAVVGVRFGMIGELIDKRSIRVRALWGHPRSSAPSEYALAGTPCEQVVHDAFIHHPRHVRERFPTDPLLRCLHAESYLGIPLHGLSGERIGVLAALHDEETQSVGHFEEVLALFGSRASAELERLHAEERLADSESRYRCIVTTCQEGIWWLDAAGMTTFVNPAMAAMLQYDAAELCRMPLFHLLHPSGSVRSVEDLVPRSPQEPGAARDVRLRRKDGAEVWTQMTTSPVRDRAGGLAGVLAFVTNVSERRVLEQRALHAQKLQSIGLLAGGVAHDFNNLLLGILGRAELGRASVPPEHPASQAFEGIENAAERAGDLTRQLLAYAGKSQVRARIVELGSVVEEMLSLLSTVISKKVAIQVQREREAYVFGDPSQMSQVVMNLIMNAGDAIEQNAGEIEIQTGICNADPQRMVHMEVDGPLPKGEYAYLKVRDTGRGMDQETQERIFEPFFSTKTSGRGLGLAAVFGILRMHHGAVRVQSELGKGSTFTVLLPQATDEQRKSSRPPPRSATKHHVAQGAVLVADDESIARDICRAVLEGAGFRVLVAADGEEAVRSFREHKDEICAVVLDRAMPNLSGEQVYVEIQRLRPNTPVVVSSGYAEQDMLELFRGAAPLAFLVKPWRGADLLSALHDVLQAAGDGACRVEPDA